MAVVIGVLVLVSFIGLFCCIRVADNTDDQFEEYFKRKQQGVINE